MPTVSIWPSWPPPILLTIASLPSGVIWTLSGLRPALEVTLSGHSLQATATGRNAPKRTVIWPPSKVKCTGLPATGGKPGRIPVPSSMAGANSVAFG
jgi:hypothetical protein